MSQRLAYIGKAQQITDKTFSQILGYIKPGLTDGQVARKVDKLLRENGSDQELAFKTLVCSGVRSALFHGPTSNKNKIKKGDVLYLDFGARYRGFCSDMTRTIFVGKPKPEALRLYKLVLSIQVKQIKLVKAGKATAEIDLAGRNIFKKHKLDKYFVHSTGHGLGKNVHQKPRISFKSKEILKTGQVITIEPGIYLPGKFGIRIEDLLIVTKSRYINLTKSSKKPIIIQI